MSFGRECSFSSSSGAVSRVFHFKITAFPTSCLHNHPDSTTLKAEWKGTWRKVRVGSGSAGVVWLSVICVVLWFAREIYINSPHVPCTVVSSCCHLRSSSPSQGKCVFLEGTWGSLLCGVGLPQNSVKMGEETAKKINLSPSLSPFNSLDLLSNMVIKSLRAQGDQELDLTSKTHTFLVEWGKWCCLFNFWFFGYDSWDLFVYLLTVGWSSISSLGNIENVLSRVEKSI